VVVSPDVGGVKRARNLAFQLDLPLVVMEKKRHLDRTDSSETYQIIGEVAGKNAILIDDIISTGGTIAHGVSSLKEAGVGKVTVCASHAVLSGNAIEKLQNAPVDSIVVTDTISQPAITTNPLFTIVSVAPLIAEAIKTIAHRE
jgi:ribose-phosphate pyrophosphokinase